MLEEYYAMSDNKISVSKINMFLQCPAKHNFCFIEKIKKPSRSALLRGTAFHSATAKNYEQKIETEKDLPVNDVLDIFSTQFDMGVPDTLWFEDEKPGEIKDGGINIIKEYHKVIAPGVLPQAVEMPFELTLKGIDKVFTGRVDIITKDEIIIDTKTKKARPSYIDGDHKLQMIAYSAGFAVMNKRNPKKVRLDYVIDKKQPECLSYEVNIQNTDIDLLLLLIGKYQEALEKGFDMPNRSNYMCSHRYCQYADECENRFGGKVKE